MKVIYKKTILEKIDDAVVEANLMLKKIEKIQLTKDELEELLQLSRPIGIDIQEYKDYVFRQGVYYRGIKVEYVV